MGTQNFNCALEKSYFVLDVSSYPFVTRCQNKHKDYWAVNFQRMLCKIVLYSKRKANPQILLIPPFCPNAHYQAFFNNAKNQAVCEESFLKNQDITIYLSGLNEGV